ncbi:Thiol:disulfide interchange protein DsbA [Serratia symbiotica]|nr:Thiol:disulfide interchange protein DsbA [Serratia symbiotica]
MKKLWLVFFYIIIISNVFSEKFHNTIQYSTLETPIIGKPKILEFFSFYCSHCYQFDQVYHMSDHLKKSLPINTQIVRYHLEFLGPFGKQLTHAWAVAMALGIENKISKLLFEAIQKTHTLNTEDDIKNILIKSGIKKENYDIIWNSLIVKTLLFKQEKAIKDFPVHWVPAIFINGKYIIHNNSLDTTSITCYIKQFINLVKFLSNKK